MPRARRHISWLPSPRRLCAGLALLAYLAATAGFPVLARPGAGGGAWREAVCGCPSEQRRAGTCCCHPEAKAPEAEEASCCCHEAAPACCTEAGKSCSEEPAARAEVRW